MKEVSTADLFWGGIDVAADGNRRIIGSIWPKVGEAGGHTCLIESICFQLFLLRTFSACVRTSFPSDES